jgi:hypothetical protein
MGGEAVTAYANKRRYERVVVDIPVRWGLTPDCPKEGRVLSLSVGGCFIRTPEKIDPRQIVYLDLWVPGARPLAGEVRYRVGNYGLGVEFKAAGSLTAEMLAHLVDFYSKHGEPAT